MRDLCNNLVHRVKVQTNQMGYQEVYMFQDFLKKFDQIVSEASKEFTDAFNKAISGNSVQSGSASPSSAAVDNTPKVDVLNSPVSLNNYKKRVFPAGTPYREIMDVYQRKLILGGPNGFTPVLVPTHSDTLEENISILNDEGYSIKEAIAGASAEEGRKFLEERYQEIVADRGGDDEALIGEFKGEAEMLYNFKAFTDYSGDKTEEVALYYIPTANPWEVPAYIPFGGFNECPSPKTMVSVCKYWYEKYKAIPTTISGDIMEFTVDNPVERDESVNLAKEHYAFCPDRVDQGTMTYTLSELADTLSYAEKWYFWWD